MIESNEPLLIDANECARLCSCGRSHWYSMMASGKIPPSIKLSRKRLWRRREIEAWITAGCPPANEWASMTATAARRLRIG
jgi:predicted DNA-binding transcriptional regulator AlpA